MEKFGDCFENKSDVVKINEVQVMMLKIIFYLSY